MDVYCHERIQKIQTIKMMEGIFICAAPHCLKSFLKKSDFEMHILETHVDLLHSNAEKEGNDSAEAITRKSAGSDSTVQGPPKPLFSGHSSSQLHDHEAHCLQFRDQPTPSTLMQPNTVAAFPGQIQNHSSEQLLDNNAPPQASIGLVPKTNLLSRLLIHWVACGKNHVSFQTSNKESERSFLILIILGSPYNPLILFHR